MKPEELKFAESHEWVHVTQNGDHQIATVGISAVAVEALTDLVYMELPSVGSMVTAGNAFGEVESVKATSDLYSPVDGEVIDVNTALLDNLDVLGSDPYGAGWIVKVKLANNDAINQLLDYDTYQKQNAG
jgi:glycine cleavage system H protein